MQLGTILLWGTTFRSFRSRLRLANGIGYQVIGVARLAGGLTRAACTRSRWPHWRPA